MSQESLVLLLFGFSLGLASLPNLPFAKMPHADYFMVTGQLHVLLEDKAVEMYTDASVFLQHKPGDGNT